MWNIEEKIIAGEFTFLILVGMAISQPVSYSSHIWDKVFKTGASKAFDEGLLKIRSMV